MAANQNLSWFLTTSNLSMVGDQQGKLASSPLSCTCTWLGHGDEEGGELAGAEEATGSSVSYQQDELAEQ